MKRSIRHLKPVAFILSRTCVLECFPFNTSWKCHSLFSTCFPRHLSLLTNSGQMKSTLCWSKLAISEEATETIWCAVNAVSMCDSACRNTFNFFYYLVIFRHYFTEKSESRAGNQFLKFSRQCSIFGHIVDQWVAISRPEYYFDYRIPWFEFIFFRFSCFAKHVAHPLVCCTHLILMHYGKLQETACMLHYCHCFKIFLHLLPCCFWQLLIRDGTTFQLLWRNYFQKKLDR